jgi:hypothetical protein
MSHAEALTEGFDRPGLRPGRPKKKTPTTNKKE